LNDVANINRFP